MRLHLLPILRRLHRYLRSGIVKREPRPFRAFHEPLHFLASVNAPLSRLECGPAKETRGTSGVDRLFGNLAGRLYLRKSRGRRQEFFSRKAWITFATIHGNPKIRPVSIQYTMLRIHARTTTRRSL